MSARRKPAEAGEAVAASAAGTGLEGFPAILPTAAIGNQPRHHCGERPRVSCWPPVTDAAGLDFMRRKPSVRHARGCRDDAIGLGIRLSWALFP